MDKSPERQTLGPSGPLGAGLWGVLPGQWGGRGDRRIGKGPEPRQRAGGGDTWWRVCPMGQWGAAGAARGAQGQSEREGGCREGQEPRRPVTCCQGLSLSWLGGHRPRLFLPVGSASRMGTVEGGQPPVTVARPLGLDSPCVRTLTCCSWRVSWTPTFLAVPAAWPTSHLRASTLPGVSLL